MTKHNSTKTADKTQRFKKLSPTTLQRLKDGRYRRIPRREESAQDLATKPSNFNTKALEDAMKAESRQQKFQRADKQDNDKWLQEILYGNNGATSTPFPALNL